MGKTSTDVLLFLCAFANIQILVKTPRDRVSPCPFKVVEGEEITEVHRPDQLKKSRSAKGSDLAGGFALLFDWVPAEPAFDGCIG